MVRGLLVSCFGVADRHCRRAVLRVRRPLPCWSLPLDCAQRPLDIKPSKCLDLLRAVLLGYPRHPLADQTLADGWRAYLHHTPRPLLLLPPSGRASHASTQYLPLPQPYLKGTLATAVSSLSITLLSRMMLNLHGEAAVGMVLIWLVVYLSAYLVGLSLILTYLTSSL